MNQWKCQKKIKTVHENAGFHMRNWLSDSAVGVLCLGTCDWDMAYIHCFSRICRSSHSIMTTTSNPDILSRDDLSRTEIAVQKQIQVEAFSVEIVALLKNLPKTHYIKVLIVSWYRRKYEHGSNVTIVDELRQRFHISGLHTVVRKTIKDCLLCRVYKSLPRTPRMGPLSAARLTPWVKFFTLVGLNYCGKFLIRKGKLNCKRWVALFTLRAIHLETTGSMATVIAIYYLLTHTHTIMHRKP